MTLRMQILSSLDELAGCQRQWTSRMVHPEALPEFVCAVCEADPAVLRPHVVLVWREDDLVGVAVARIEQSAYPVSVGYVTFAIPHLKTVRLSYRGLLGAADPQVSELLFEGLWRPIAAGEADVLEWDQVPIGDTAEAFANRVPRGAMGDLVKAHRSTHWLIDLPQSYDALVSSYARSTRHSLKQRSRALEKEFSQRLTMSCYRKPEDHEAIIRDTEAVAQHAYQRALGVGYLNDVRAQSLVRAGLKSGTFSAYILSIDREPIAYWHVLDWNGTRFASATGYRADRAEGSGGYLLQRVLQDACGDPQLHVFDFGFGHAEYKRRIATRSFEEYARSVFAKRPKPMVVNVARGVADRLDGCCNWLLVKMGVREEVKARWRRYLIAHGGRNNRPAGI